LSALLLNPTPSDDPVVTRFVRAFAQPAANDPRTMAWILLIVAGLLEVVWAIGMKQSQGFTKLWPSVWTILAMLASFGLLAMAMKSLPLGVSYTVWVGIGAVGSVIAGAVIFGERMNMAQYVCVAMIGMGILGLKLTGAAKPKPPVAAAPSASATA
jgi:quaternary ammonium compound-resistance protein SugE